MTQFDEETLQAIDEYAEELSEAIREHDLLFWEGCTVVTAPTGAPPEYITVMVDGVNDPNVCWRGVPGGLTVGDEVKVSENPISHRREIEGASGATGATTPFIHDHYDNAAGGPDLNPETISERTLIVGVGCPYTTLGAAVAAVPGVPCTIKIMGATTVEAGAVTVPVDVAVTGMGEGSVIGMGANTLTMTDDSSLMDVVVTHSGGTAIDCNNADCTLFNVHVIVSNEPAYGVDITGDSVAELYHVTVDFTTSGATVGFHVAGTATPLLWDCQADDTTNINDALQVSNASCTVITKYCNFHGYGNDVWTGAASTWIYHQDDFDPDNCTVNGIADPADGQEVVYFPCTKTAGAAGDFATVQAAIDWFKNRLLCAACKVDIVTSASYAEALVIEDVFCAAEGRLELEGDTRGMAAATWVDAATVTCQDGNAGTGTAGLANAGNNVTVTGSTGNPNFANDGWGANDKVVILDNAGVVAEYVIFGVAANVITLTVAAPAVGNNGTALYLKPNVEIAPGAGNNAIEIVDCEGILLDGLHLDATAGAFDSSLRVTEGGHVICENTGAECDGLGFYALGGGTQIECNDGACSVYGADTGANAVYGATIFGSRAVAFDCASGIASQYGSSVDARNAVATVCSSNGFYCSFFSALRADTAFGIDCDFAYRGIHMGGINANGSSAIDNVTAYYAGYMAYVYAPNTCANLSGNLTNYSPATGTVPPGCLAGNGQGNVFGVIYSS